MLYLNDCDCGRKHCQENAACVVKNHLAKVSLKESSVDFLIEYAPDSSHSISHILGLSLGVPVC